MSADAGRLVGGRYRLGGVLGRGGMGTVWRGEDEILSRTVAVKELRFPSGVEEGEKQRLITRTLREAKAIARIRSKSAITVFDVVDEDGRPWIVMELVEGRSLAEHIRKDGPLSPRRAAEVGLAVLDVLRAAHREGILHRDVKPSNVLLEEGTDRVVLTDFGIAKVEGDPSVTSTGMLVGAPSYISPERARGKPPGPPADLWSLGGLLYAAVEGSPPYDKGSAISTLTAVMTEPVPPPEQGGELSEVIYGLLTKEPEQRLDVDGAWALLEPVASGRAPERPASGRGPAAGSDSGSGPRSDSGSGSGSGSRSGPAESSGAAKANGAVGSGRSPVPRSRRWRSRSNGAGASAASAAGAEAADGGAGRGGGGSARAVRSGLQERLRKLKRSADSPADTGRSADDAGAASGSRTASGSARTDAEGPGVVGPSGAAAGEEAEQPPASGKPAESAPVASAESARTARTSEVAGASATAKSARSGKSGTAESVSGGGTWGVGHRAGRAMAALTKWALALLERVRTVLPERAAALTARYPRRTLAGAAAAVVVLVVLLCVLVATMAGGDATTQGKGAADGTSASGGAGAGGKKAGEESDSGKSDDGKGSGESGGSGGSGEGADGRGKGADKGKGAGRGKDGGAGGKAKVPAGYHTVTNDRFHFSVAMPKGWKRTGVAGASSGVKYSGGGLPKIQLDYSGRPRKDAAAAWRQAEPGVSKSPGYHRLGIKSVHWRGYPTVADWQFTRRDDGQRVRVLNRGFEADDSHGHAIFITCKAGAWDDKECRQLRKTAFRTFEPKPVD